MKLLRLLRVRWAWWLIPFVVVCGVAAWLAMTRPEHEPTMPMDYGLPTDP